MFLLLLHLVILSGVISPLFSSSILGTYQPEEFIFQCPIFLPFHTVHAVLKERILQWFAIPFSSGPCFAKEESEKASLKLSIKIAKIMASSSNTSWQIEGEKLEAGTDFIFKIL